MNCHKNADCDDYVCPTCQVPYCDKKPKLQIDRHCKCKMYDDNRKCKYAHCYAMIIKR